MSGPRSTSQLRQDWAPACTGPWVRVTLYGGAVVSVRPGIVEAVKALNAIFQKYGYKCTPPDCGCYNCRKITGGSGYSLHALAIALDINWTDNPYQYPKQWRAHGVKTDMPAAMIADIRAIRTNDGAIVWRWGGDYATNKDTMHLEVVCTPASLARGINWNTVHASGAANQVLTKTVWKQGDTGAAVGFIQGMLNLAARYRINDKGKVGGGHINVTNRYDRATTTGVREFQRYCNADLRRQGKPASIVEDGIYGPVTAFLLASVASKVSHALAA